MAKQQTASSAAPKLARLQAIYREKSSPDLIDKVDALRGLNISITTTAKSDDECKALLAAFKFPFKN